MYKINKGEIQLILLSVIVVSSFVGIIINLSSEVNTSEINNEFITPKPTPTIKPIDNESNKNNSQKFKNPSSQEYANSLRNRLSTEQGVAFFSEIPNDTILNQKETTCDLINNVGMHTAKAYTKINLIKLGRESSVYINNAIAEDIASAIIYTANEYGCK